MARLDHDDPCAGADDLSEDDVPMDGGGGPRPNKFVHAEVEEADEWVAQKKNKHLQNFAEIGLELNEMWVASKRPKKYYTDWDYDRDYERSKQLVQCLGCDRVWDGFSQCDTGFPKCGQCVPWPRKHEKEEEAEADAAEEDEEEEDEDPFRRHRAWTAECALAEAKFQAKLQADDAEEEDAIIARFGWAGRDPPEDEFKSACDWGTPLSWLEEGKWPPPRS